MKSDQELIRAYVDEGSEEAFAELVHRHVGAVHASAFRQLGDSHAAQEVCQTVFIVFSKKAASLRPGTILIGWLMQAVRYAALDYRKTEHRRLHRETAAFEMSVQEQSRDEESSMLWMRLAPCLDEAVASLAEPDRNALWLRFFQQKSLAEVGSMLGCAEDAARKRVSRALERLHEELRKRGITSPVNSLPSVLFTQLSPPLPDGIVQSALAAVAKPSSGSLLLAEQVASRLAMAAFKAWLIPGLTCGILLIGSIWMIHQYDSSTRPPSIDRLASDYRRAGFAQPDPVHDFIGKLRQEAAAGNRAAVASMCRYPLRVNYAGRTAWVSNSEDLIQRFDSIFTPGVCGVLLKSPLQGLLCSPEGVAVGDGAVWVAPDPGSGQPALPQVIAINLQ